LAVGFAEYLGYFFPAFSGQNALIQFSLGSLNYSLSAGQVIAVMAIILLSAINELGIKTGAFVQNIFTVMRLGGIAVFVALGIFWGNKIGVSTVSQLFEGSKSFRFDFFGLAIIAALWTYDGWYSVSCTAEEVKNPQRNIPLGLILGTLAVTLVYLTVNLLYIVALPLGRMRGVLRIGEVACAQLLGSQATSTFAAMVAVVIFGCLNANIIFCPRVCYALAEEGLFFRPMKSIHPRYRVPSKAIWGQAVWSSVLCLSGTYKGLFEYVIFALVIFFALTGLAVIILRRKNPEIPRPYRVWGYPAVPLLFVAINLAIFINALKSQPLKSLIGLGILLIGFPAYVYWRRKNIPAGNKNEGRSSEGCL
jgi:APA family basic amino acid/polyamine antiporter